MPASCRDRAATHERELHIIIWVNSGKNCGCETSGAGIYLWFNFVMIRGSIDWAQSDSKYRKISREQKDAMIEHRKGFDEIEH